MSLITICENIVKVMQEYWHVFLLEGVGYTLLLSFITVFFGTIIGAFLALGKMSRFKLLRGIVTAFVEIIRGTPILLQLYFGYFILPTMILPFLNLSEFTCIAISLIINSAAYVSEVIRSGIQAVDHGQTEAARSLGLNGRQTMLRIVIPQAVKNILPALGNEFIMIIKETSLASTFFIGDLMTSYLKVKGVTWLNLECLIIVGIIYFVITFTLSKVVAAFERRMRAGE